jgi:thiamine pyrophosphate-dependent acetolactate synthase large subunit-like protein
VTFAIVNDARMRMVESGLTRIFGRTAPMDGPRVDFVALAEAVGAVGYRINRLEDIAALPEEALRPTRPTVLDISIDTKAVFPAHGRVAHLKNFANG